MACERIGWMCMKIYLNSLWELQWIEIESIHVFPTHIPFELYMLYNNISMYISLRCDSVFAFYALFLGPLICMHNKTDLFYTLNRIHSELENFAPVDVRVRCWCCCCCIRHRFFMVVMLLVFDSGKSLVLLSSTKKRRANSIICVLLL